MTYDELFLEALPLAMTITTSQRGIPWQAEDAEARSLGPGEYQLRVPTRNGPLAVRIKLIGETQKKQTIWAIRSFGLPVGSLPDPVKFQIYEIALTPPEGVLLSWFVLEGDAGEQQLRAHSNLILGDSLDAEAFIMRLSEVALRASLLQDLAEQVGLEVEA